MRQEYGHGPLNAFLCVPAAVAVVIAAVVLSGCAGRNVLHDEAGVDTLRRPANVSSLSYSYRDRSGEQGFEQVRAEAEFTANRRSYLPFGISDGNNWVRFRFADLPGASRHPRDVSVYLNFPGFGMVRMYEPVSTAHGESRYRVVSRDATLRGPEGEQPPEGVGVDEWRSAEALFPVFTFSEDLDRDGWVYLSVNTPFSANFQLLMVDRERLTNAFVRTIAVPLVLLGVMAAMLVFHLVVYLSTRRRSSLVYSLYALLLILYLVDISSLANVLLPALSRSISIHGVLLGYMVVASYLLFVWLFLDVPSMGVPLRRVSVAFWGLCGVGVVVHLRAALGMGQYPAAANALAFVTAFLMPLIVTAILVEARRRGRWVSVYYMGAVFVLVANLLVYVMRGFGVLPHNGFTQFSAFGFAALEAALSSAAVAAQIRVLQQRNRELREREREQYTSRIRAEESARAKSSLLAHVGHDLHTPLNGIVGFAELLRGTPLSGVQQRYVENISNSTEILSELITDVLDLSRIEAGKLVMEDAEFDLYALIDEAVDLIAYQAAEKGLTFLLALEVHTPRFMYGDKLRLKQVLLNLLTNGVKFTPEGEVELRVSFERSGHDHGTFRFSVHDTGIGMNEGDQRRVFEAFERVAGDGAWDSAGEVERAGVAEGAGAGAGLGLSIAQTLVQNMGGCISLWSVPGEGSRFSFELSSSVRSEAGTAGEAAPLRVLVVEGNAGARAIAARVLRAFGCHVQGCAGYQDALEQLGAGPAPDLLFVDCGLPDDEGGALLHAVRTVHGHDADAEGPYCVALHGVCDDPDKMERSYRRGADAVLLKPLRNQELLRIVTAVAAGVGLRGEVAAGPAAEPAPAMDHPLTAAPVRVLIADDHPLNRELLESMLPRYLPQVSIATAQDGVQALEQVRSFAPELIFMDLRMPRLGGAECAQAIREQEAEQDRRRACIIGLTAALTAELEQELLRSGMDYVLSKPLRRSALLEVLRYFLAGYSRSGTHGANAMMSAGALDLLPGGAAGAPVDPPELVRQLPGIDLEEALENNLGDHGLVFSRLRAFVDQYGQLPQQLQRELAYGNLDTAGELSHSLAGLAAGLGATSLYTRALELERKLQAGLDPKSLEQAGAEIQHEMSRIQRGVAQY